MRYLDFKKGQKYEVLMNPAEIGQGYFQTQFEPGEVVVYMGCEDAIHESYTILCFARCKAEGYVKFSANRPEPDWERYFREVLVP